MSGLWDPNSVMGILGHCKNKNLTSKVITCGTLLQAGVNFRLENRKSKSK